MDRAWPALASRAWPFLPPLPSSACDLFVCWHRNVVRRRHHAGFERTHAPRPGHACAPLTSGHPTCLLLEPGPPAPIRSPRRRSAGLLSGRLGQMQDLSGGEAADETIRLCTTFAFALVAFFHKDAQRRAERNGTGPMEERPTLCGWPFVHAARRRRGQHGAMPLPAKGPPPFVPMDHCGESSTVHLLGIALFPCSTARLRPFQTPRRPADRAGRCGGRGRPPPDAAARQVTSHSGCCCSPQRILTACTELLRATTGPLLPNRYGDTAPVAGPTGLLALLALAHEHVPFEAAAAPFAAAGCWAVRDANILDRCRIEPVTSIARTTNLVLHRPACPRHQPCPGEAHPRPRRRLRDPPCGKMTTRPRPAAPLSIRRAQ